MVGDQAAVAVLEAEAADEADIRELMDSGLLPEETAGGVEVDGDVDDDDGDEIGSNGAGWDDASDGGDDEE